MQANEGASNGELTRLPGVAMPSPTHCYSVRPYLITRCKACSVSNRCCNVHLRDEGLWISGQMCISLAPTESVGSLQEAWLVSFLIVCSFLSRGGSNGVAVVGGCCHVLAAPGSKSSGGAPFEGFADL